MKSIAEIYWYGKKILLTDNNYHFVGKEGLSEFHISNIINHGFFDCPSWLFYTYFLEEDKVHINITKYEEGVCVWLSAIRESVFWKNDKYPLNFGYIMSDLDFKNFLDDNKFLDSPKSMYELSNIAKAFLNNEPISDSDKECLKRRLCFSW